MVQATSIVFISFSCLICYSFTISPSIEEKCNSSNVFVENFIKYACYQTDNTIEAKIVGCQPSNNLTGVTLEAWETFDDRWFKYHCVIDGKNAQYSVKACLDPIGEVLPVGKTRSFQDGETFTCFIEKNKVKLNHQTTVGCQIGDQVYGDRATWVNRKNSSINIGTEEKIVGLGTAMQCRKSSNGTFFVELAACLTTENTYIRPDSYGTVDGEVVKCDLSNGECQLKEAISTELACRYENRIYRHNDQWITNDKTTAYVCQFGKIEKKGCYIGNNFILLYSTSYVNGEAHYCYQESLTRSFGSLKGCTKNDGKVTPFGNRVKNGEKIDLCGFLFNSDGTITFQWTQVGCVYSKEMITVNSIQKVGEQYVHCVLNGTNGYTGKVMTRLEVENWLSSSKQQWSNIVSGNEGEGKSVKREVPTVAPSPTIPSTTSTTTTSPTAVTTTTTTTTTSPTTTTTTSPLTTTTTEITLPPSTITPRTTISPTAQTKRCVDLIEDCSLMRIYCKSETDHIDLLKTTVESSSLNAANKYALMDFIEMALSHESQSEDERNNAERGRPTSKFFEKGYCECKEQNDFNREIVQYLCPKTCNSCNQKKTSIHNIIKLETAKVCKKYTCNPRNNICKL